MRDVLFRGKARLSTEELDELEITHENGWVFGNYIENGFSPYIVGDLADVGNDYIAHEWWVEVIPESVGQWTGKKGIFEGDIYQYNVQAYIAGHEFESNHTVDVTYENGAFWVGDELLIDAIENDSESKIIGNIYENPELLEGATNGGS